MTVSLREVRLPLSGFDVAVDGEFAQGWTGLIGPSGAGKTSLLELIAGFREPSQGTIAIHGRVVFDSRSQTRVPPRKRGVGYVTQDETLFPHLSVRANLAYGVRRGGNESAGFEPVVSLLVLRPLLERSVTTLSGGEKRRVSLARALLSNPKLLLLDEPLTGLDTPMRDQVIGSLRTIHSQLPVPTIYVAHNPEEVLALCDEVLVLERGRIQRRGTPGSILSRPADEEVNGSR